MRFDLQSRKQAFFFLCKNFCVWVQRSCCYFPINVSDIISWVVTSNFFEIYSRPLIAEDSKSCHLAICSIFSLVLDRGSNLAKRDKIFKCRGRPQKPSVFLLVWFLFYFSFLGNRNARNYRINHFIRIDSLSFSFKAKD